MLRCDEVTRLCASEDIRGAPWRRQIAVRIHLMMCRSCRRYVRELAVIGRAVRSLAREAPDDKERTEALLRSVLPDDPPRDP